ncbi:hypothetical protein LSH36_846g00001 [Paralvinella palmiformis]|uniref:NADAR domain-containing protein n=1 Tax=Paralvinella palmiformis TaxID=53620 RepID=A0AAD9MTL3_9ANNE|nr:hypothetical protein LSH36_846g00001 [Paralvinella palmiformis]
MQQDSKVSKAFTLNLGHLNDFIKPANSTEKIRYNLDQMNRTWNRSVPSSAFLNKTLENGIKKYGKKLNNNTIREFKNLLMKGHPNKKELQTSSFRIQQRATFQESRPTKVQNREEIKAGIRSDIGPRDPLSNFFQCRFNFRGYNFKSLEHAYHWEKAQYFGFRGLANEIEAAGTAAQAKSLAREIPHSENWDRIRISLMRELLRLKWEQVPIFRDELNACRSKEVLHPVPDTFWGTGVGGKKDTNSKEGQNVTLCGYCACFKLVGCRARIKEQDGVYCPGETEHCHPPSTGMTETCKVQVLIKSDANNQPFAAATQIIESAMWEVIDPDHLCQALSQPSSLRRGCNRQRANGRPNHLKDLAFPDKLFLADVTTARSTGARRDLIFATT